jgi:hypothetical protein
MVYPIPKPNKVEYQPDNFEQLVVSDFTGGLNITDPVITLPPNQFRTMLNLYYNRQGTIGARFPFRPYSFKTSTQDKPIVVDSDWEGDMYRLKTLLDYQVFRETLSNGWSYNDEVHVVSGVFEDIVGSDDDVVLVAVYNSSDEVWTIIWAASDTVTTAVSVCPYKINQAFDLIIFPDDKNPERWSPSSTTSGGTNDHIVGDLSDLGLTAPTAADSFTATGVVTDSAEGLARIAAGTVYYKFSFVYDDKNVTTRYGESASTVVTDGNCDTGIALTADATKKGKITITFTTVTVASTISKVRIYRAPDSSPEGPYKYVGETEVTSTTAITTFVDTIPWGEEGIEPPLAGSNPSLSGSELSVLKARTVGAYIVGFDASMDHKLIWCDSGSPDVWTPLNFDYLDNTGVRAIEFNRKVYIFTGKSCWQKENMDSAAVKISNIGCIDDRSIQEVGNGLMWMDYDTIYFADFVSQYGSKGDFPKDIGHRISESVNRRLTTAIVNSCFFERRYYITYTDTEDNLPRTYVYDVDIGGWTQHSAKHLAWARGSKTLYSLGATTITKSITVIDGTVDGGANALITSTAHGLSNGDYVTISGTTNYNGTYVITWVSVDTFKIVDASQDAGETGQFTITKHYAFGHNYSATVSDAGESEYSGKDYHDYAQVAQTTYTGISNISVSLSREDIKLGGDYRKVFVSSLSIEAEGSVISILATLSSIGSTFETSKTFASGTQADSVSQYEFVFDESIFADGVGNEAEAGDADEAGFAGYVTTTAEMHKKFNRVMKSNAVGITLTAADARGMSILYIVIYWKPYAAVA